MKIATLLPLACTLMAGCEAETDNLLLILQNNIPNRGEAGGCTVSSTRTDGRGTGQLDVRNGHGYFLYPNVQNFSDRTGAAGVIFYRRVDVTIAFPDPDLFSEAELTQLEEDGLLSYSVNVSGSVPAGSTTTLTVPLLSDALVEQLRPKIPADGSVAVDTTTQIVASLDGHTISTQHFPYTLDVCDGCLLRQVGDCATLPDGFTASKGGECNPDQDLRLDCCMGANGPVCPAEVVEAPEK